VVHVHRDKLFSALEMLADGRTVREVARETGLSFTQLKEIREVLPLYVEVKELEKKLLELRDEYNQKIKEFEATQRDVEKLKRERQELEREVQRIKREKEELERKLGELMQHSDELLKSVNEAVKNKLLWAKNVVDGILAMLTRDKRPWLIHEVLPPIKRIDEVGGITEWIRPGYTCIRDDTREVFNTVSEARKKLKRSLEELSKAISEAIAKIEKV